MTASSAFARTTCASTRPRPASIVRCACSRRPGGFGGFGGCGGRRVPRRGAGRPAAARRAAARRGAGGRGGGRRHAAGAAGGGTASARGRRAPARRPGAAAAARSALGGRDGGRLGRGGGERVEAGGRRRPAAGVGSVGRDASEGGCSLRVGSFARDRRVRRAMHTVRVARRARELGARSADRQDRLLARGPDAHPGGDRPARARSSPAPPARARAGRRPGSRRRRPGGR